MASIIRNEHQARGSKAIADEPEAPGNMSGRWRWMLVRGLLFFAIGVFTFLFPLSAILVFAFVFSGLAFADGVISLVDGLAHARRREPGWAGLVVRGGTGILIGVGFVFAPMVAAANYALLILLIFAIWLLLNGLSDMSAALRIRQALRKEWLLGAAALLSMLLGVTILAVVGFFPHEFLQLSWIMAVYAIAAGLTLGMQALRLKRMPPVPAHPA